MYGLSADTFNLAVTADKKFEVIAFAGSLVIGVKIQGFVDFRPLNIIL